MNKSISRVKASGEVFTPPDLVSIMLDKIDTPTFKDKDKKWLEPSAGDGNFLIGIKDRMMSYRSINDLHPKNKIAAIAHILNKQLFSIELMPDNHWLLLHRIGYFKEGKPNPEIWKNEDDIERWFKKSKRPKHPLSLSQKNPHSGHNGCDDDEVFHHIHHVCADALLYLARPDDALFSHKEGSDSRQVFGID